MNSDKFVTMNGTVSIAGTEIPALILIPERCIQSAWNMPAAYRIQGTWTLQVIKMGKRDFRLMNHEDMLRWVCPGCRRSEHLGTEQEYTCPECGTERSLEAEEFASDFMNAIADSDADVDNFSAGMFGDEVRVRFDLLKPEDADLLTGVGQEHGFGKVDKLTYEYRVDVS